MANVKHIYRVSPVALEIEVLQLTSGKLLDSTTGDYAALPVNRRTILTSHPSNAALKQVLESRKKWATDKYVVFFYEIGGTDPVAAGEVEIVNDVMVSENFSSFFLGTVYSILNVVPVLSQFDAITMEKGAHKTFSWQYTENGVPKDISALVPRMAIKAVIEGIVYTIGPVVGTVSQDTKGIPSIMSFTLATADTDDMAPFFGAYSVALFDINGEKFPLTPPAGVDFILTEDIIDVPVTP